MAKVQTNLKLAPEQADRLSAASRLENRDKADIVEEALRLREELLGGEYKNLLDAAATLRFSADPEAILRAAREMRKEVPGMTADGATTIQAVRAKLHARSQTLA